MERFRGGFSKKKFSISVNWRKPGNNQIKLTGTNSLGCDTTVKKNVRVLPPPDPSLSGPATACVNEDVDYHLQSDRADSVNWDITSGRFLKSGDSQTISVKWRYQDSGGIQANKGNVKAEVITEKGCRDTVEYSVKLNNIKAEISPKEFEGCVPQDVVFSAHKSENASDFKWKFEEGAEQKKGQRTNYTFNKPGFYDVRLVTSNQNNCSDTAFGYVKVSKKPNANFTIKEPEDLNDYVLDEDKIVINNQSQNANHFTWDFGNGFVSNQINPTYKYGDTGNYDITLYVTKNKGCMDSISKTVNVIAKPYLHVPNAFSPNGDHLNDAYEVVARNISDFKIAIFNKWGEQIYQSTNQDFSWDGQYQGQDVPLGSYLYEVTAKSYQGEFLKKSGSIKILK